MFVYFTGNYNASTGKMILEKQDTPNFGVGRCQIHSLFYISCHFLQMCAGCECNNGYLHGSGVIKPVKNKIEDIKNIAAVLNNVLSHFEMYHEKCKCSGSILCAFKADRSNNHNSYPTRWFLLSYKIGSDVRAGCNPMYKNYPVFYLNLPVHICESLRLSPCSLIMIYYLLQMTYLHLFHCCVTKKASPAYHKRPNWMHLK